MSLGDLVTRMVAFVRAGYPHGVPETDYIPLLALLRRRLTDDEVAAVAAQLAARGELNIDTADIGAAITRITDQLPSPADLDRVQRRLETIGWPVDPDHLADQDATAAARSSSSSLMCAVLGVRPLKLPATPHAPARSLRS